MIRMKCHGLKCGFVFCELSCCRVTLYCGSHYGYGIFYCNQEDNVADSFSSLEMLAECSNEIKVGGTLANSVPLSTNLSVMLCLSPDTSVNVVTDR